MSSRVFPNKHGDLNVTDAFENGRSFASTPCSPSLADAVQPRGEDPKVHNGGGGGGGGGGEKESRAKEHRAKLQHFCSYAEEHQQDVSAEINSLSKVRLEDNTWLKERAPTKLFCVGISTG